MDEASDDNITLPIPDVDALARFMAGEDPLTDLLPLCLAIGRQAVVQALVQHRDAPTSTTQRAKLEEALRHIRGLKTSADDPDYIHSLRRVRPPGTESPLQGLILQLSVIEAHTEAALATIEPTKRRILAYGPNPRLVCAAWVMNAWAQCHGGKLPGIRNPRAHAAAAALWSLAGGPRSSAGSASWSETGAGWERWLEKVRNGEGWTE